MQRRWGQRGGKPLRVYPCAGSAVMWNDWNDTGGVLRRCGTTEPIQCPDGANTTPDARGMPRHRKNRLQCKVPWGEGAAHIKEKSQARPGKEATGAEETVRAKKQVGCQRGATRSGVRANINRSARQAFDSTVTLLSRGGGDGDEYDDEVHIRCKSGPCFDEEKAHHTIPGEACGCATALAARLTTLSLCRKTLKLTTSPLCTEAARLTTTSIRCRHPTNAATYPRTISSSDGRKSVPRQQLWPGRRRDCSSERSKDYR